MRYNYFKYTVDSKWLTAKYENNHYYILEPESFELYELNALQGKLIYQLKVLNTSLSDAIDDLGLNVDSYKHAFEKLMRQWMEKGII